MNYEYNPITIPLDEKIKFDMISSYDKLDSLNNEIDNIKELIQNYDFSFLNRENYIFEVFSNKIDLNFESFDLERYALCDLISFKQYIIKDNYIKYNVINYNKSFKFYDKFGKLLTNKYPKRWLFENFEDEFNEGLEKYNEEVENKKEKQKEKKLKLNEISENIKNKLTEEELEVLSKHKFNVIPSNRNKTKIKDKINE